MVFGKKKALFLFIKWPSESYGCSSYPQLVGSLSKSLPRMEKERPKTFNWEWVVSTKEKGLGVSNVVPHGNSIL